MTNPLLIVNLLISKYTLDEVHKLKLLILILLLSLSKEEQKKDAPKNEINSLDKKATDESLNKNSMHKQNFNYDNGISNYTDSNASIPNINPNTNLTADSNTNVNISSKPSISTNTTINSSDKNIFNLLKNGFQGTNTTLLLTTGETITGQVLGSYYGNVIMIKVGAVIKFIDGNSIIGFY